MVEGVPAPIIVKLGGSLLGSPQLRAWLAAVAEPAPVARIVVPGGGRFADGVRLAQKQIVFSDLAAHRMAILAMQQVGLLFADLEPRLRAVEDRDAIDQLLRARDGGIWLPWRLAGSTPELPARWEVTSDSIALWLARRLGAAAVMIIKRGQVPQDPAEAQRAGTVDAAFAGFLEGLACPVHILGEKDCPRFRELVAGDSR